MGFGERRGILVANVDFRGAQARAGVGLRAFRPTMAEMPREGWPAPIGGRPFRQFQRGAHARCDGWRQGKCRDARRAVDAGQGGGNLAITPKPGAGNGDGPADAQNFGIDADLAGERRSDKSGVQSSQLAVRRHQTAHCLVAEGCDHAAEGCAALGPILADDGSPPAVPRLHRRQGFREQHTLDVTGRVSPLKN